MRQEPRPSRGPATFLAGARIFLKAGKDSHAERVLRKALAAYPTYPALLDELANLLAKQGRLPEAAALRRHGPDSPKPPVYSESHAHLLSSQGKTSELEAYLRDCAARSQAARDALVGFLMRHDRFMEAARILGRKRGPLASQLHEKMKDQVQTFIAAERFAEARPLIESLLAASPDDHEAFFLRARWLRHQGRGAAATKDFQKAARLEPRRMRTYLHWAEALRGSRKAPSLLRDALKLCPPPSAGDVPGLTDRYLAAIYCFDFAEAAGLGEKVLDQTRGYEALRTLGWVCPVYAFRSDQAPDPVEAILKRLNAYLAARPACPWGNYWKVYFSSRGIRARNPDRLSGAIRVLSALGERYAWMRYEIGKWRFERQDYRGAAKDFRAALHSSDPPNWRAQCFFAEALWCLGERSRALEAFRAAEALSPDYDLAGMRAWKGEVLLWGGEYALALELVRSFVAGSNGAAPCEGAALFKLGRSLPALRSLDCTIAVNAACVEARIWRAEVLLSLGRLKEASREIDAALRLPESGANFYCRVLGGLIHDAQGDRDRARAEFSAVPRQIRALARKKAGLSGKEKAGDLKRILEKILELSRGVRSEARINYWAPPRLYFAIRSK